MRLLLLLVVLCLFQLASSSPPSPTTTSIYRDNQYPSQHVKSHQLQFENRLDSDFNSNWSRLRRTELHLPNMTFAFSPVMMSSGRDLLVINQTTLICYSLETKQVSWSQDMKGQILFSPNLYKEDSVLVSTINIVCDLYVSPTNVSVRWCYSTEANVKYFPTVSISQQVVVITGGFQITLVNLTSGQHIHLIAMETFIPVFRSSFSLIASSAVMVKRNVVILTQDTPILFAVNIVTKSVIWWTSADDLLELQTDPTNQRLFGASRKSYFELANEGTFSLKNGPTKMNVGGFPRQLMFYNSSASSGSVMKVVSFDCTNTRDVDYRQNKARFGFLLFSTDEQSGQTIMEIPALSIWKENLYIFEYQCEQHYDTLQIKSAITALGLDTFVYFSTKGLHFHDLKNNRQIQVVMPFTSHDILMDVMGSLVVPMNGVGLLILKPCVAGYSCDDVMTVDSVLCPDGMECEGDSNPIYCAAGYFCVNQTKTICPLGFYCPMGSHQPIDCEPGHYCQEGSTTNQPCQAGFYCALPSTMQSCPIGYYCPLYSKSPIPCITNGSFCPKESSQELPCPIGYYCSLNSEAVLCPKHYVCTYPSTKPVVCNDTQVCPEGSSVAETCTIQQVIDKTKEVCVDRNLLQFYRGVWFVVLLVAILTMGFMVLYWIRLAVNSGFVLLYNISFLYSFVCTVSFVFTCCFVLSVSFVKFLYLNSALGGLIGFIIWNLLLVILVIKKCSLMAFPAFLTGIWYNNHSVWLGMASSPNSEQSPRSISSEVSSNSVGSSGSLSSVHSTDVLVNINSITTSQLCSRSCFNWRWTRLCYKQCLILVLSLVFYLLLAVYQGVILSWTLGSIMWCVGFGLCLIAVINMWCFSCRG